MANPRNARIVSSKPLNEQARLLDLVLPLGEPLNFTGGQYVIVNTNIPLPGGKIAKRAYSILSSDENQSKFQIAVKKVGSGPGSNFMHETEVGAEIAFSGPWGQFVADPSAEGPGLVLATDTGITAALGLIQGGNFRDLSGRFSMLWLAESSDYFLPPEFVAGLVQNKVKSFEIMAIPSVNDPGRLNAGLEVFKKAAAETRPQSAFLSGDGALLYPFKDELVKMGLAEIKIKIECFFNNPFKKVGA